MYIFNLRYMDGAHVQRFIGKRFVYHKPEKELIKGLVYYSVCKTLLY